MQFWRIATMSTPAEDPASALSPERLKQAFKAFKKRLKLTRLDHESRLSGSPLTGRSGLIAGIVPPTDYPQAVWDELVRQGKLKKQGGGIYGLAEEER
jgi:hypothetical protein